MATLVGDRCRFRNSRPEAWLYSESVKKLQTKPESALLHEMVYCAKEEGVRLLYVRLDARAFLESDVCERPIYRPA